MPAQALKRAVERAAGLPPGDQETIGLRLNAYIDDLQALRAMLDEGARALDAGQGRVVDIEQFLASRQSSFFGP